MKKIKTWRVKKGKGRKKTMIVRHRIELRNKNNEYITK